MRWVGEERVGESLRSEVELLFARQGVRDQQLLKHVDLKLMCLLILDNFKCRR